MKFIFSTFLLLLIVSCSTDKNTKRPSPTEPQLELTFEDQSRAVHKSISTSMDAFMERYTIIRSIEDENLRGNLINLAAASLESAKMLSKLSDQSLKMMIADLQGLDQNLPAIKAFTSMVRMSATRGLDLNQEDLLVDFQKKNNAMIDQLFSEPSEATERINFQTNLEDKVLTARAYIAKESMLEMSGAPEL